MKKVSPLLQLENPKGFATLDEKLHTGQAGTCDLFIHACEASMTFSLLERSSGKFLAAENILEAPESKSTFAAFLRQSIQDSQLFSLKYHQHCTIAVSNSFATLVPSGLLKQGDEYRFLQLSVSRDDLTAGSSKVNGFDLQVAYGIQPEIRSLLQQLLPNAKILHGLPSQLDYHWMNAASTKGHFATVCAYPGLLTVIVSEGKKLIFANSFLPRDTEEAVYYLLNVCEQLELDRSVIPMELYGTTYTCEALQARLQQYVSNLHATKSIGFAEISYKLKELPAAALLPALVISLCE